MKPALRRSLLAAALCLGLAVLHYFAPLQGPSVVFYLALVALLAGLLSLLRPLRWLDIGSRPVAGIVIAVSLPVAVAALCWPATLHTPQAGPSRLDAYMPQAEFDELHTVRIHVPTERAWTAVRQVSFAEVGAYTTLMRLRAAASGYFGPIRVPDTPIMDLVANPRSGFTLLEVVPGREFIFCMVGRPWSSGPRAHVNNAAELAAFAEPASIKVVANVRVDDLGDGWSAVSTQTRITGTDPDGRRLFARYWHAIYPGSAIIRRMWLNAICARAERGPY